jgi:hypothetical protein
MKKLNLKALELGAKELFTRDQLKNVLGGGYGALECKTKTCSAGTGSVVKGTWKVTTGSCKLNTVIGQNGQSLSTCDCSATGEIVNGCGSPS